MTSSCIFNLILCLSVAQVFCLAFVEQETQVMPWTKPKRSVKRVRRGSLEKSMRDMNLTEYMATCGSVFDIEEGDAIISTPLNDRGKYATGIKCSWTVVGNHYCRPLLQCDDFDLRKYSRNTDPRIRCKEEYLEVTDGLGGEVISCDRNSLENPFLPSKPGYDMYIEMVLSANKSFDRSYGGLNCVISCSNKHPLARPKRMPRRGFERRTNPNCTCGARRTTRTTKIDEYPWHVAVVRANTTTLRCSGTLINNFYVLTTASCLMNSRREIISRHKVEILAGANSLPKNPGKSRKKRGNVITSKSKSRPKQINRSMGGGNTGNDPEPLRIAVSKVIPHEGFNAETLEFDICLLRLWAPLELGGKNKDLGAVCLPPHMDTDFVLIERYMTSVGWNLHVDDDPVDSKVLNTAHIPILSNRRCEKNLKRELSVQMMCAGYVLSGNEYCVGDIGSPLIDDNRGTEIDGTQTGILSYTDGCGGEAQLQIYTKLSSLMQWIYHNTHDATWCKSKRGPMAV